jgi:hemerythrin-like domain-containing protein
MTGMDLITAIDGRTPESAGAADVLRRDHDRVRELFREYRRRMDEAPETCRLLAGEICMQWELHTRLENEFLYPAMREEAAAAVQEAARAHEDIQECIAIIRRWPPDSERDSTMLRLMQLADHHMRREEEELFPRAERACAMGRDILHRREELAGSTGDLEGRS